MANLYEHSEIVFSRYGDDSITAYTTDMAAMKTG